MEISPELQSSLLFWCIILGVCTETVWEFTSSLVYLMKEKSLKYKALLFLLDFITVSAVGVIISFLCYYFNKGEVRFFAFAGFFSGFFVVKGLFGKWLKKVFCKILSIIFVLICSIFSPLVKIFKYLVNKLQKIIYFIRKVLEKFLLLVYNIHIRKSVIKKSRNAFLKKM